jgi:hypothetical protein
MQNEIRVGEQLLVEGTTAVQRATRLLGTAVATTQGFYYEQASRGRTFSLHLAAWTSTVNTGNIVLAATAQTAQFCVWNPTGSGKNLSLLKFATWPISGTAPVPPVSHSAMTTNPTNATSVLTPITCNNVGQSAACVARAISSAAGVVLVANSALTYIRSADLYITAGTAANLQGGKCVEFIDGDIVIPPGTGWVPTWAAAGTTFLGGYSVEWEEIPVQSGYPY